MDFAQQQHPGKALVGISVVPRRHPAAGWALVNGLAQQPRRSDQGQSGPRSSRGGEATSAAEAAAAEVRAAAAVVRAAAGSQREPRRRRWRPSITTTVAPPPAPVPSAAALPRRRLLRRRLPRVATQPAIANASACAPGPTTTRRSPAVRSHRQTRVRTMDVGATARWPVSRWSSRPDRRASTRCSTAWPCRS